MLEIYVLWFQIILCCVGIWASYYIFKLINHGNAWWIMSLGFFALLLANVFTLFYASAEWYVPIRVLWLPLFIRIAFVCSVFRILKAAEREHNSRIKAESATSIALEKIRELTLRMSNICPFWNPLKGCENPDNPNNAYKS